MPTTTTAKSSARTTEEDRDKARRDEQNRKARAELTKLLRSTTQGEWLTVCRYLDLSRDQIADDDNLTLLAMAYVADKRKHGASSFDVLLELTDRGLLEFHGFAPAPLKDEDADPGE